MGCVAVNIAIACSSILPTITNIEKLSAKCAVGEKLRAKVGIVCSIPEELAIQFAKNKLVWEGATNNDGVVLYNTLISTGEWSLEEITIEELL